MKTINLNFDISKKYLLAVSGGIDSMVLLHAAKNYDNVSVITVDHCIRSDSTENATFVKTVAAKMGFNVHVEKIDIPVLVKETGMSVELIAREERHKVFQRIALENNYDYIVLAHHADDQVETMLFNLMRGTGVAGLAGMQIYNGNIYRPLLSYSKKDISNYAIENGLIWFEDSTNTSTEHDRNWIRNVLIPMMEERRPGVKSVLVRETEMFRDLNDYLEHQTQGWMATYNYHDHAVPYAFDVDAVLHESSCLIGNVLKTIYTEFTGSTQGFSNKMVKEFYRWIRNAKNGSKYELYGMKLTLAYLDRNSSLVVRFEKLNQPA